MASRPASRSGTSVFVPPQSPPPLGGPEVSDRDAGLPVPPEGFPPSTPMLLTPTAIPTTTPAPTTARASRITIAITTRRTRRPSAAVPVLIFPCLGGHRIPPADRKLTFH